MISLDVANRFCAELDPDGPLTFQTYDDSPEGNDAALARVLHGIFKDHGPQLRKLNEAGAGIFVMVNAGDGLAKPGKRTCRTAANVIRVRANFVDLDGAPVRPILLAELPPHWIVQSS